jgi:hypothetical protein
MSCRHVTVMFSDIGDVYRHSGLNDTWDVSLGTLLTLGRIALLRLCSAQGRFVAASFPHTDKRKSKRG